MQLSAYFVESADVEVGIWRLVTVILGQATSLRLVNFSKLTSDVIPRSEVVLAVGEVPAVSHMVAHLFNALLASFPQVAAALAWHNASETGFCVINVYVRSFCCVLPSPSRWSGQVKRVLSAFRQETLTCCRF